MYPRCSFLHGRPSHAQNLTAFPRMMSGLTGGVLIVRSARTGFDNEVPLNSAELVFEWLNFALGSNPFPPNSKSMFFVPCVCYLIFKDQTLSTVLFFYAVEKCGGILFDSNRNVSRKNCTSFKFISIIFKYTCRA